jgi:hypothetical protein
MFETQYFPGDTKALMILILGYKVSKSYSVKSRVTWYLKTGRGYLLVRKHTNTNQ